MWKILSEEIKSLKLKNRSRLAIKNEDSFLTFLKGLKGPWKRPLIVYFKKTFILQQKYSLNKQKSFAEQNLRSYFAVVSLGYVKYAIIALSSTKLHLACRKEGKQAAFWNMTLWWSLAPICSRYCLDKEKVVFNCIACVFSIFPLDDLNTSPFSSTVMSAIHFPLIIKQCLHALMLRPRYGKAPLAVCPHLIF